MPMTVQKHYSKAPIVEAVIDLRCEFAAEQSMDNLERVRELLVSEYPVREDLFELRAQIAPVTGVTSEQKTTGFRALTKERTRIAGIGLESFTFSWLAPYDRWETLRDEAFRVWELYSSVTNPVRVARVGVRFINRLDLPNPDGAGVDLDRYLRTAPEIAPELPQHLESFFLRFQLLIAGEPPANLTITEMGVAPLTPGVVSVLLDIDAFVQGLDVTAGTAWQIIERLRQDKNFAFESSITDATRELIL
jgi:uncharacterized protein (TIGR04255 family)